MQEPPLQVERWGLSPGQGGRCRKLPVTTLDLHGDPKSRESTQLPLRVCVCVYVNVCVWGMYQGPA